MGPEARQIVLATVQSADVPDFARVFVNHLMRPGVVLTRVWLADSTGDLRLAASAGFPTGGGSYNRVDGQFGHIAAGAGKIGQIAHSRTPLIARVIRGDEDWLANPGWIARQGVRTFLGYPLIARADVAGVLAIFDRTTPSEAALEDLQFLADYAAARIADLRTRDTLHTRLTLEKVDRPSHHPPPVLTRAHLRALEKETIEAALAQTNGKVFGPRGAAVVLGMKPTTLASRIKALGLRP